MPSVDGITPGYGITQIHKHIDKTKFRELLVKELNEYNHLEPQTNESKLDQELKKSINIKYIN